MRASYGVGGHGGRAVHVGIAGSAPSGPAYTVVLICHVAAVLVGLVAVTASFVASLRLLAARDGEPPPSVRSYFSPGFNWAGRSLWLVPALGGALLGMSGGDYRIGDAWVLAGIGLWMAAIALGEVILWPAERRVQRALAPAPRTGDTSADPPAAVGAATLRAARTVCASAAGIGGLLAAAMVVMVAKP
jgi:hypothetical protein